MVSFQPLTVQLPIGTSQNEMRPYTLEISTASTEMWVLGKTYRGLTKDNNPYDPTRSTTSRWNGDFYTIEDEMEVSGNATIDVLNLSQIDSSLVFNQSFGVVNISWDYELREYDLPFPVDGVFVPTKPTANSPLQDFVKSPLIFFNDMTGGVIHFDSFHFGPHYKYEISGESVLVDSGSPLIYLLEAPYWVVWTAINPTFDYELGFWTVDCQKAKSLPALVNTKNNCSSIRSFQEFSPASGNAFKVPASSYLLDVGLRDGQCIVAIDYTNYMSTN
ncbi:hypothetical protein M3Y99_01525700 [Aphelenchoides fujianensis]|nr:hypothetical protein M3Y99_01525700 [Aphelenchoides fujianensis]